MGREEEVHSPSPAANATAKGSAASPQPLGALSAPGTKPLSSTACHHSVKLIPFHMLLLLLPHVAGETVYVHILLKVRVTHVPLPNYHQSFQALLSGTVSNP